MKKYFFFFVCTVLFVSVTIAQDTLYKRNGDIVITKVLEVNPDHVKYKNYLFMEGPIYVLDKTEIFMIRYQNGLKEIYLKEQRKPAEDYVLNKNSVQSGNTSLSEITNHPILIDGYHYQIGYFDLHPKKVDQLLLAKKDKQISLLITAAQSNKKVSKLLSFAPIPCGIGAYIALLSGVTYSNTSTSNSTNYLTLTGLFVAAGIGTAVVATVLNAKSKKQRKRAVELYNLTYYPYK